MLTRRRFLEQTGLIAGSSLVAQPQLWSETGRPAPVATSRPESDKLLDRARELLGQAPLIDTHNDLPSMLIGHFAGDLTRTDLGIAQPRLCGDVPRMREGRVGAQYWSVYVDSATMKIHTALHEAIREFDVALRLIRSQTDFEPARTADDLERIHRSGRIASLIGVEGGHMIENSPAALRVFHELGARYLTLTHWDTVDWADAATDRADHDGITELGERIVRELNRLGMFVDISHVSPATMRDALRVSRAPVIFSHSNALAVNSHARNVPDDVLRLLPANGGVVHVNFIKQFVWPGYPTWEQKRLHAVKELHVRLDDEEEIRRATAKWTEANPLPRGSISDVADHIDHIRTVAGIDHIGIGSDFHDAGANGSMAEGLDDVTRYPYLFAELLRRGYSDDDVLKIAGRNHLRAMRRMETTAADLQRSESPLITEGLKGR